MGCCLSTDLPNSVQNEIREIENYNYKIRHDELYETQNTKNKIKSVII